MSLLRSFAVMLFASALAGCGGCGRVGFFEPLQEHVQSLAATPSSATLVVGQRFAPRVFAGLDDAPARLLDDAEISWASASPEIVAVEAGQLVARAIGGPVKVTALAYGVETSLAITVREGQPVTLVSEGPDRLSVGARTRLSVALRLADGTMLPVSDVSFGTAWSVAPEGVLAIDREGWIEAKTVGVATLTVRWNGLEQVSTVRVTPADVHATGLEVRPLRTTVATSSAAPWRAFLLLSDGTEVDVTERSAWSASGLEMADSPGWFHAGELPVEATIAAAFDGWRAAAQARTVTRQVSSLAFEPASLTLSPNGWAPIGLWATFEDGLRQQVLLSRDLSWSALGLVVGERIVAGPSGGNSSLRAAWRGSEAQLDLSVRSVGPSVLAFDEAAVLALGERRNIKLRLDGEEAASRSAGTRFDVVPEGVVRIDADGMIDAHRVSGPILVTAHSGDLSAEWRLDVVAPEGRVHALQLPAGQISVEPGASLLLAPVARVGGRADAVPIDPALVAWFSERPEVVSIDADGLLRAHAPGRAVVIGGYEGERVRVDVECGASDSSAVSIAPTTANLTGRIGAAARLALLVTPEGGTTESRTLDDARVQVSWQGTPDAVAWSSGGVTFVKPGAGKLLLTAFGQVASVDITVTDERCARLDLSPGEITLPVGFVDQLSVLCSYADGKVVDLAPARFGAAYRFGEAGIAEVDSEGRIGALRAGQTLLSVRANGASTEATVRVRLVPVQRVAVAPAEVLLPLGASAALACSAMLDTQRLLRVSNAEAVWLSSNPLVVTVDANGLARSWRQGEAEVSCLVRGVIGTALLTVGAAAPVAEERADDLTLHLGEATAINVGERLSDGSFAASAPGVLVSDAPAVADVSIDGVVRARAVGVASISSELYRWSIRVIPPAVESLGCAPLVLSRGAAERLAPTLTATLSDETARTLEPSEAVDWRTSGDVVRFDRGTFVPLREGAAVVWAYFGGAVARCSVEVVP